MGFAAWPALALLTALPVTARFEIWFLTDDRISILVETDLEESQTEAAIIMSELWDVTTVAAVVAGVIANLRSDSRIALCNELEACSVPASLRVEDIPSRLGDFVFVLPGVERGRKGFEGTIKMKGGTPVARWKPRGFGLFSREVQDYTPTATMALLLHVLGGLSHSGRVLLVETAHILGGLGLAGAIGMTNHAHVAMAALTQAVQETNPYAELEPSEDDE